MVAGGVGSGLSRCLPRSISLSRIANSKLVAVEIRSIADTITISFCELLLPVPAPSLSPIPSRELEIQVRTQSYDDKVLDARVWRNLQHFLPQLKHIYGDERIFLFEMEEGVLGRVYLGARWELDGLESPLAGVRQLWARRRRGGECRLRPASNSISGMNCRD